VVKLSDCLNTTPRHPGYDGQPRMRAAQSQDLKQQRNLEAGEVGASSYSLSEHSAKNVHRHQFPLLEEVESCYAACSHL
jgi:hypothetical protein